MKYICNIQNKISTCIFTFKITNPLKNNMREQEEFGKYPSYP